MNSRLCPSASLALLLTYACAPGIGWAKTPSSPAGLSAPGASSDQASPSSPSTVTVPGPLRSFLRMAAISQKISPDEALPLLARNVTVDGYSGTGLGRRPTEYLTLLEAYLKQARELLALAGPDGVIRVANCKQAQPLLTTLGYRVPQSCGPDASVETADPKKAFLTVDSGFPLADLEETLRGGKPFAHTFPSTQVPVLFSQRDWTAGGNSKEDVIDNLLHDPQLARLYWALARMDENSRTSLRQSPGLERLAPLAAVLDFYGSQICIRSGRVAVPGGAQAEPAWKDLVGTSPDSPGEFVTRLLTKDEGWLAAYFDALSRVSATQQAYFTEPQRLPRFYEALRGRKTSPGPARPVFRPDPGLLLFMTRLQLEPNGQPHVPGNLEVWDEILGHKTYSKLLAKQLKGAKQWKTPEQLVEAMLALSRVNTQGGPLQLFLVLSEMDRERSPQERLTPATVRLLAEKYSRLGDQYLVLSQFGDLNNDSITRFIRVVEALDRISDRLLRADAVGMFQANVGLWQILARQGQIPKTSWNQSWQRLISPFADIRSSSQLFDAGRGSLGEVLRAATGRPRLSQPEIIALLAGPQQPSPAGQKVKEELANKILSVLESQRLVSLDTLFALGDGMNQKAQGKTPVETMLSLAGELEEFQMPKPLFTSGERTVWPYGLYGNPHIQAELQTDLTGIVKAQGSPEEWAAARGRLVPFLRDTLVGLNYAYYAPPGAQMLHNNSLFVRSHDFSGEMIMGEEETWKTPNLVGRGWTTGGGAHLAGSLADLPYVLAQVEENFIVPENVQSLIWEDLVPSFLASAVLPRWWRVTQNELHAVTLYQRFGEDLLTAAARDENLRKRVMGILCDRMFPQRCEQVEAALSSGHSDTALSQLAPGETFYLAGEFRRAFPEEARNWGSAGRDLDTLARRFPEEVSLERLSEDFGVPHPALAQTYACELLDVKPFPTFMGYSSRLLAESWDSNNLYWARLADEGGYPAVMLHVLVPQLTHRMVQKIFATYLEDWPALLRALRETGEEFRLGKVAVWPDRSTTPSL